MEPVKLTIYGASWCQWCMLAKELAVSEGYNYEWKDFDTTEVKEELKARRDAEKLDFKTIPQIWVGSHYIGGYDDFFEFVYDGR